MKEIVVPVLGLASMGVVGFLASQRWNPEQLKEEFHKLGDVNRDGNIDTLDMLMITFALGSTPGTLRWNSNCDLNGDGIIDRKDLDHAESNLGLTIKKWIDTLPIFCLS